MSEKNTLACPKCGARFGYPAAHVLTIALSRKKFAELILGIRARLGPPSTVEGILASEYSRLEVLATWLEHEIEGVDFASLEGWIAEADALLARHLAAHDPKAS